MRNIKNIYKNKRKITLIIILSLIATISLISNQLKEKKRLPPLPIAYSESMAPVTKLQDDYENIEKLIIVDPEKEFPRYLIKYKNRNLIQAVKVSKTTHENIEREILIKNNINYSIAQKNWLKNHPEIYINDKDETSIWEKTEEFIWKNILLIILLVGAAYIFRKGLPGANGSHQLLKPYQIKGDMNDLIGMEDIKREIGHLEQMIKNKEIYQLHNVEKPFNIMLSGPAGTGKTKIAGYLAKKLNMPLIQTSGSNLENGLVGGGSKTINAIYAKACKHGRCIIFLDEAQSLFMRRGRGERKWDDDTANTLLSLLDGIKSKKEKEIIWIVASNFDDVNSEMDEAMLRRFSVKINFRYPNKRERIDIIKSFLHKKNDNCINSKQLNIDYIADVTANLSPAIIETIIDRSSLIAIEENKKIDTDILLRAFERTSIGLTDRASNADSDKQRERVAIHELGHFFMQIEPLLKKGLSLAQIKDRSRVLKISTESVSKLGALGYVLSSPPESSLQTMEELEQEIMEYYGGVAAEEIFYGSKGISIGSQNDIQKATMRLELMMNQLSMYSHAKLDYRQILHDSYDKNRMRQIEQASNELYSSTLSAIRKFSPQITKIKNILLDRYVLSKEEIFTLLESSVCIDNFAEN